jgi:hypothetical protein
MPRPGSTKEDHTMKDSTKEKIKGATHEVKRAVKDLLICFLRYPGA